LYGCGCGEFQHNSNPVSSANPPFPPPAENAGVRTKQKSKAVLAGAFFLLTIFFAYAATWTSSGTSFLAGTFNNTLYNATGGYIRLNWSDGTNTTYASSGTYLSEVKDFNKTSRVLNLSWNGKPGTCPANTSYVGRLGGFCIDQYEASHSDATTCANGNTWATCSASYGSSGTPKSAPGMIPWTTVSQTSAKTACQNAGKYLCSSKQWLAAANMQGQVYNLPADLAVSPYYCVTGSGTYCLDHSEISGEACNTGSKPGCVSAEGVYDMAGNVWEWTSDVVDVTNPGSGANWYYISTTDGSWNTSSAVDNGKYGKDGVYFPATITGRAVLRGGGWGDGGNAGLFSAALNFAPSYTSSNFGFRCCQAPN